ncbi:MAG: type II toxin-antitoxin system mRNA interferase toxin, RelE/StbE family [Patescibacteria group bacterium]|nr:type II toxin-antitoxin system mRNA interferase toxin, RelE/StbE family [Patescibacteria group bacterium]
MIEILYKPSFLRQFNKLPSALQDEVEDKISLFYKDPNHPFLRTHKLKGRLKGFLSFSVNYEYRIVFKWIDKKTARFFAVGDHDVYNF